MGPVNNKLTSVWIMTLHQADDKPLLESMLKKILWRHKASLGHSELNPSTSPLLASHKLYNICIDIDYFHVYVYT